MEIADHHLYQFHQGNAMVRTYIEEFKLLAVDLDWNEPALISQFRSRLNRSIAKELIRQGIPCTLEDIYLASITAESCLVEIQPLYSSPCQLPPPITTPSLPTTPDLEGKEPMQIGVARQAPASGEVQRCRELALFLLHRTWKHGQGLPY